ncbi:MAG: hypothetical protein ACRCYT_06910 [Cetobacterium sp.]
MTNFYISKNDTIIMETEATFKGRLDRCVLYLARKGFVGNQYLILKGIDSKIKNNRDSNVVELDMLLDAIFNKDLNDRIKKTVEYSNGVVSRDCTADEEVDCEDYDETDREILKTFVEEMKNIGIEVHTEKVLEIIGG